MSRITSRALRYLDKSHKVFDVNEELPDQYVISVCTTFKALESVKANKATGPNNIPAWVLRNYANVLAPPLTAIFNNSLREGVLPVEWKMANVIPLPKTSPPVSIEKDIRPISLTPIAAKVFESIIMKWVDETIEAEIDAKQFGGISGTSTTDVLVELVHMWYKATDKLNSYVRVVMLDFSKAFDLINHHLLLNKLQSYGLPAHILRWMATFLLDRAQRVKIGNEYSHSGHPNGGVPQGTLSGPKCFVVVDYINDLRTTVPLYRYVDDSTLFAAGLPVRGHRRRTGPCPRAARPANAPRPGSSPDIARCRSAPSVHRVSWSMISAGTTMSAIFRIARECRPAALRVRHSHPAIVCWATGYIITLWR
ncbi:hypothetical protein NP493_107g07014 [Ridgeia piscesae]|uniref:Reverse transcriptase domain-containing protein n=1 Tax=Ridgeia piscesae TaxID=27915 RepID=A0AAD9P7J3_RIDPI|nr:hypothetical protein NP493_107g07014 [Ridgeia piscesae]